MIDTEHFKKQLNKEKSRLIEELEDVGMKEVDDPTEWQPKAEISDRENADPNEVADRLEGYGERTAIETTLEQRLKNVESALACLESGTYGYCNVGGARHEIESERLEANPAASTCLIHLDTEIL